MGEHKGVLSHARHYNENGAFDRCNHVYIGGNLRYCTTGIHAPKIQIDEHGFFIQPLAEAALPKITACVTSGDRSALNFHIQEQSAFKGGSNLEKSNEKEKSLPKDFKFNDKEFWKIANDRLERDGFPKIRYARVRIGIQDRYTLVEVASSDQIMDRRMCRNVFDGKKTESVQKILAQQIHSFGISRRSKREKQHSSDIALFYACTRAVQNYREECRVYFRDGEALADTSDVLRFW